MRNGLNSDYARFSDYPVFRRIVYRGRLKIPHPYPFIASSFDMQPYSILQIAILALQCSAASIQPWLQLIGDAPLDPTSLSSNQTTLPGSGSPVSVVDPRFSFVTQVGDQDLSDKSTIMTCLRALYELAPSGLQHFLGVSRIDFSNAEYGDVKVFIRGFSPAFQVRHAIWAVATALFNAYLNEWKTLAMDLWWEYSPSRPKLRLGRLDIALAFPSAGEAVLKASEIQSNLSIASDLSSILTATSGPLALSNGSDSNVSITADGATSLSARRRKSLRVDFEGARLSKGAVASAISGGFVRVAASPRSSPFQIEYHRIGDPAINVNLAIDKWPEPRISPPYLEYEDVLWMLYKIPRYMYENNKFQAGEFVLLVDEQPLASGSIKKSRATS